MEKGFSAICRFFSSGGTQIRIRGGTEVFGRLAAAGIPLESIRHLFVTHHHFDAAGGLIPLFVALRYNMATRDH